MSDCTQYTHRLVFVSWYRRKAIIAFDVVIIQPFWQTQNIEALRS
jgi:hypothetical protein